MRLIHQAISLGIVVGLSTTLGLKPAQSREPSPPVQSLEKSATRSNVSSPPPSPSRKKRPQKKFSLKAIAEFVMEQLKRVPKNAITRTSSQTDICVVAPGLLEQQNEIINDRPLFVWQGIADSIEVQDFLTPRILWSASLNTGVTYIQYSGQPLQPGNTYIWTLKLGQKPLIAREFKVMSRDKQEQILSHQASEQDFTPYTSKNLADAAYFAQNSFWSDALTALNQESAKRVDSSIDDKIQTLSNRLCNGVDSPELAHEISP